MLGHQFISHHHFDTQAIDSNLSRIEVNKHVHQHNSEHHHKSHQKCTKEKDSDKEHKHSFPLHHHVCTANEFDFIRTNIQESHASNHCLKIVTVLCLFHLTYSAPTGIINTVFGDPPFLINSQVEPGAIALRGPPSIV